MRNYDMISGLFLALLSLVTCVKAYRMGLGTASEPGPGLIAFGIAAVLGAMSLFLFVKGIIQIMKGYKEQEAFKGGRLYKIFLVLALIVAYGVFFKFLGFLISTFLFMLLLLWPVGRQRLRTSLAVSVLTVLCAHLLFVVVFSLPLPRGTLLDLFGG